MLDAYSAHSKSIGDLLGDGLKGKMVVPEFQRGYSWGKKHVEAFWKDIMRFQKETLQKEGPENYFLGPIVVMQPDDKKGITYILDGQQRLATATILFSVLRDLAKGLNTNEGGSFGDDVQNHLITKDDYGFSLELGELDREFFQATIQSLPPVTTKPKIRSHRGIWKAREILMDAVKQTLSSDPASALKQLSALRTIVRRDLIMASIPVKSQRDAFRIFETLNDRGPRLSVPDLLLNFLMGLAKDDSERKAIRKYWDGMIEGMGKKDASQFLRHVWVSKYGDLKNVDLFTALKDHIENKNIQAKQFAHTCSEECNRYLELLRARKEEIGDGAPYIDILVNDLGFEVALPLLLSAHTVLDKGELEKVGRLLLVFVTRYTIFAGLDPSGLENTLYSLARDIREKPQGKILSHIKGTLVQKAPSDKQLEAMKLDGDNFLLEQQDAVYVMGRLANRMQSKTKEIALNESNLEHIFPKNPSTEWKNTADLEPYLWHLGNLTMLGKRLNSNVANSGFTKKREYYEKNSELEITKRVAKDNHSWDVTAIHKRTKQLVPLILEIWNFDNPSRV
jgi:hypothetical protein